MPKKINYKEGDLIGEAYFLYDVKKENKKRYSCFRCKCGNTFVSQLYKVKILETRSCGCIFIESVKKSNSTHGLTNHKLYGVWKSMKSRCYTHSANQFNDYGGRGVIVCDEWKNNFINFYNWAIENGWKDGMQLDKDILGNGMIYSPEYCLFVTPKQNSNKKKSNKYIYYNGENRTISEWADYFSISVKKLYQRLSRGWDFEKSVFV